MKLFEADSIAVTAIAVDSRGNLYAATMPEGKLYKISTTGKSAAVKADEPFCRLRAPYVWSLIVDKQDRLFAGTARMERFFTSARTARPKNGTPRKTPIFFASPSIPMAVCWLVAAIAVCSTVSRKKARALFFMSLRKTK